MSTDLKRWTETSCAPVLLRHHIPQTLQKTGQNQETAADCWGLGITAWVYYSPETTPKTQTYRSDDDSHPNVFTAWPCSLTNTKSVSVKGRFALGLWGFYPWKGAVECTEKEEGYCHSQSPWSNPAPCVVSLALKANMLMLGWNARLSSSRLSCCEADMHFSHYYGNRLISKGARALWFLKALGN